MSAVDVYPIFIDLARPFRAEEVKSRSQAGRTFKYITARTVMNRLDDGVGPGNWWDDYVPLEHSVICRLTIQLPDGRTVTKCDAGGYAGLPDEGDDDKSAFSDAFKRAAVKFGIGRYLYNDGVPSWAEPEAKANPNPAAPVIEAETPGQTLAKWAARNPDALDFLTRVGSDLGFPKALNTWNQEQCEKASNEWHKVKRARRAQEASAN
jgi:hypothetical protein